MHQVTESHIRKENVRRKKEKKRKKEGRKGKEGGRPPLTRAAHERTDAHARYSHGFLALWRPMCRGQHRSGLPPFFFPLGYSSLSKHHEISPSCADHEHGVCRHAHVPNSHSLEASASPCGRASRKDEGCAVNAPFPFLVFPFYTSHPILRHAGFYAFTHSEENEGRPRALTCTRVLLPRFFQRQARLSKQPPYSLFAKCFFVYAPRGSMLPTYTTGHRGTSGVTIGRILEKLAK